MHYNKLVIFMPSIEGGGVEKNLFIIGNFLGKKIKNTTLITADKKFNFRFKNIAIINPRTKIGTYSSRKWKYFLCFIELIKLIIHNKNITVFAFQANFYCVIICKIFFDVKLITRSNSSPSGWSQNFLKKKIFKYLFKKIDQVIVNSEEFKYEIKRKFNSESICIYNPLNKSEIKKLSQEKISLKFYGKPNELKIINVGRYVDQKDHITLLKALNLIKHQIKFRALIIGRGILKNDLVSYIKQNKLTDCVKLISFQKNPFKFIKMADVFVLSSKYEGLPNVLLESLVLGKYIISTNCPTGPNEILSGGKGGDLYNIQDYKSLAQKIINFNNNKKKLFRKIKYAQSRLSRFDYRTNLYNYLKIVRKYL
jgi:glycosyltransferase involved in cell wall biosynthesis